MRIERSLSTIPCSGFAAAALPKAVFKPLAPRRKVSVYEIWSDWVAAKKEEAVREGEVKFLSTNYLIFSTFCKNLDRCDVSMTAVNFRDRIPEFSQDLAGNCVAVI